MLPVEPKAFRVLLILLRNPQKLITKEELLNAVWGDAAVTENSLTRSIALLRRLLGDDIRNPRYIETVATVGYRFVCKVEVSEDAARDLESRDLASRGRAEAGTDPPAEIGEISYAKVAARGRQDGWGPLLRWLLPGTAVLAAGVAVAIWYLRRPLPPPRITRYAQITHDGHEKRLAGTDGSRLYFTQMQPKVPQPGWGRGRGSCANSGAQCRASF